MSSAVSPTDSMWLLFRQKTLEGPSERQNRQMLENIFLLKAAQLILGFFSSLNISLACNIILLFPPYVFLYSVCNSLWQSSSRFHMRGGDHTTPCSQTFHPFAASQSHWADLTPSALPRATHGHRKWLSAILESPRRRGIQTPSPKIYFAGSNGRRTRGSQGCCINWCRFSFDEDQKTSKSKLWMGMFNC